MFIFIPTYLGRAEEGIIPFNPLQGCCQHVSTRVRTWAHEKFLLKSGNCRDYEAMKKRVKLSRKGRKEERGGEEEAWSARGFHGSNGVAFHSQCGTYATLATTIWHQASDYLVRLWAWSLVGPSGVVIIEMSSNFRQPLSLLLSLFLSSPPLQS